MKALPLCLICSAILAQTLVNTAKASSCTVTESLCTQGPETRLINNVLVYRDCWQWQEKKTCTEGDNQNFCAPLEATATCKEKSSICSESLLPGSCAVTTKTFLCEDKLDTLPTEVTPLAPEIRVTDHWVLQGDCAMNETCTAPVEICTRPDDVRVIEGISVTLACGEKEKSAQCETVPANPSCTLLENVGCKKDSASSEPLAKYEERFSCHEKTPLPVHPDIHIVDKRSVLDRIEILQNTCDSTLGCEIETSTCLENDKAFPNVCLKEEQLKVCHGSTDPRSCDALVALGCKEEKPAPNDRLLAFRCESELSPLPSHITEVDRESIYTDMTETNTCPVTSASEHHPMDTFSMTSKASCQEAQKVCLEGPETRIVNGQPIYKDCWRYEVRLVCENDQNLSTCEALENDKNCQWISSTCLSMKPDGTCDWSTKTYSCIVTPDQTVSEERCTQTVCQFGLCTGKDDAPNTQLGDTLTKLELARQAAVYGDYENLRFFSGEANTCRNKLGGVSCCRGKVRGNTTNSAKLNASYIFAKDVAQETIKTLGSAFVNDVLANHDELAQIMTKLYGEASAGAYSPNLSYYGLSVSYGANGLSFNFSPTTFFAMIALEVATDYLSCTQEEQALQLKRGSDLCHYIGSTCTEYNLGRCQTKTEVHCCFNSGLARLVQEAAHEQLGLSWGTPSAPSCTGLSAHEFAQVDLGKVNLDELLAVMSQSAKTPDVHRVKIRAQKRQSTIDPNHPYAPMPTKDGVCTGNAC